MLGQAAILSDMVSLKRNGNKQECRRPLKAERRKKAFVKKKPQKQTNFKTAPLSDLVYFKKINYE